jgi:hypothetical protein
MSRTIEVYADWDMLPGANPCWHASHRSDAVADWKKIASEFGIPRQQQQALVRAFSVSI